MGSVGVVGGPSAVASVPVPGPGCGHLSVESEFEDALLLAEASSIVDSFRTLVVVIHVDASACLSPNELW